MSPLLLAVAYALSAALLLNIWIASRWHFGIKILLVLLMAVFYIGSYNGIRDLRGWPTDQTPPERFRLLSATIVEPDKRNNSDGHIYLWLQALDEKQSLVFEPRGHRLPYSIAMAEKVQKAMEKTERGATINGQQKPRSEQTLKQEQAAGADVEHGITINKEEEMGLEFSEQAAMVLPAKDV